VGGVVLVGWGGGGGIFPPAVGGDIGAGGRKSIFWVFFGAYTRFWWWVVWIYRPKYFGVVRPLKRLFDSTKNKRPADGYLNGAQNKRGG
jgi:hypothetical protein